VKKSKYFVLMIVVLTVSACSSSASFTKTGDYTENLKKSKKCDVTIYTTHPNAKYYEIGLIEFSGDFWGGNFGGASSVTDAKEMTSDIVCNNGGNGLFLWEANGAGNYKKATVVYVEKKL